MPPQLAAGNALGVGRIVLQPVKLPALLAIVAQDAPVQLQHLAAAGLLVQAVDVLGDDGLELALRLSSSASFRCAAFGCAPGASIFCR